MLFLATLTIWSFYHARPRGACGVRKDSRGDQDGDGEDGEMEEEEDEEEIIWDAKIHMHQLLEYMIRSEPRELLNFSSVTGRRNCECFFFFLLSFIHFFAEIKDVGISSSSPPSYFCLIEEKKTKPPPFTDSFDPCIL